ncbi:TAXI family TRAP transporter solute-binding subunit [Ottowia sp.]|uniref:TAXI family TRAP transporter solute-binding subunit n=1 Tax=Ottowia sp. TaxID=1898956 RepID=UPI0039450DCD
MRRLTLILLSIRDLLVSAGPLLLLAAGLLVAAYWWLQPQPPKTVRLATGPAGSAYAGFGQRYVQALAREGITVQLIPTEGSVANLKLLQDGGADVAFVRGGSGAAPVIASASAAASEPAVATDSNESLQSLGALFYEPLWIFVRQKPGAPTAHAPGTLAQLKGLRVSVDQAGSGVPALMQRLLKASGVAADEVHLSEQDARSAAQALLAGRLDAVVLTSAPQSPVVRELLHAPGVRPLELSQADAYTRRFPFFRTVTLPRGVADLAADVPPHDVTLLAATTSLLTREQTHPALRQLFAQAAQTIHGRAGWLNGAREFPNTRTSELPVSPEGDRAINGTPAFWQNYLPFWASNLVQRMWLVIGGLIVLLLPLSRVVPPLYTYRVRQRVFRWYARLRQIETRAQDPRVAREQLLDELDELDRVAHHIAVPLAHADELYALRDHIATVRQRILMQRTEGA